MASDQRIELANVQDHNSYILEINPSCLNAGMFNINSLKSSINEASIAGICKDYGVTTDRQTDAHTYRLTEPSAYTLGLTSQIT